MNLVTSIVVVFLISASPVGEILVAIPAGVALGMEPALAFVVAYLANIVPVVALLSILELVGNRFPRIFNYLAKEGRRFRRRFEERYGSVVMLLVTPVIGVYATSISAKLLGFSKKRSFALQALSLGLYGVVETLGLYFGLKLIPAL